MTHRVHAGTTTCYCSFCNCTSTLLELSVHFSLSGWQGSKAALPIMCRLPWCIWAALQFKLYVCVKHTVYRCLAGESYILMGRFLSVPLVWSSQATSFHWTKCPNYSQVCMQFRECTVKATSSGSSLWPCVDSTYPMWDSACIISAEAKHSLTNHILGWGSQLKWMSWFLMSWFELIMVNRWCDFSRDHKRYTGYVWTLNISFI